VEAPRYEPIPEMSRAAILRRSPRETVVGVLGLEPEAEYLVDFHSYDPHAAEPPASLRESELRPLAQRPLELTSGRRQVVRLETPSYRPHPGAGRRGAG